MVVRTYSRCCVFAGTVLLPPSHTHTPIVCVTVVARLSWARRPSCLLRPWHPLTPSARCTTRCWLLSQRDLSQNLCTPKASASAAVGTPVGTTPATVRTVGS